MAICSRSWSNWMVLGILIIAGILISSCQHVWAVSCDNDIINLATKCKNYVVKGGGMVKPSRECCEVVKKVNVPCVCSHVTKQIEEFISMKKVFYVAKTCGKKVAHGTKCGSYRVPSA